MAAPKSQLDNKSTRLTATGSGFQAKYGYDYNVYDYVNVLYLNML